MTIPDDTEPERYTEDLEPELEDLTVGRTLRPQMQCLKNGEPRGQPDREGREDDMERDGERELQPG
jgi:hypothetical protein